MSGNGEDPQPGSSEHSERNNSTRIGRSLENSVRSLAPTDVYKWGGGGLIIGFLNWVVPFIMSTDLDSLKQYGVTKTDKRYIYYLLTAFFGWIGIVGYLIKRRERLLNSDAFSRQAYEKMRDSLDIGFPSPVLAGVVVFTLGTVFPAQPESVLSTIAGVLIIAGMVITPVGVFYDIRELKKAGVVWGKARYWHYIAAIFPWFSVVYLYQRKEHVFYTALVKSTKLVGSSTQD